VGYAYYQILGSTAYVRHVIASPDARRLGVGRALMDAIARRARAAGCTTWCLNVKPENAAAVALYERVGMRRAFGSRALRIRWTAVDAQPKGTQAQARRIRPDEDAHVESVMGLVTGQLSAARTTPDRVLLALESEGALVGAAVFHPHFPGAYPFRVAHPDLAVPLLCAIRPYARPTDTQVNMMIEGQPEVADALEAIGAEVHLVVDHMRGPVPA
jgi:hypothetical protein